MSSNKKSNSRRAQALAKKHKIPGWKINAIGYLHQKHIDDWPKYLQDEFMNRDDAILCLFPKEYEIFGAHMRSWLTSEPLEGAYAENLRNHFLRWKQNLGMDE